MLTHIKSNDNHYTVVIDGEPQVFDYTHPEYEGLCACILSGDAASFMELITVGTAIQNWSEGEFEFRDGCLYFQEEQIADQPTDRIIDLIRNGWPVAPMLAYLTNLYANVSNRAVQESYTWCQHKGLPITEDGMLVGYKGCAVYQGPDILDKNGRALRDGDTVDRFTGCSFRNNVGDSPSMNRRQVCDDMTKGCSQGLHIGTYEYAQGWAGIGGRVVLVKFNPKDIVSVPSCSDFQKMRVSSYTVIGIARDIIESPVFVPEDEDEDIEGWQGDYDCDDFNDDDDDFGF